MDGWVLAGSFAGALLGIMGLLALWNAQNLKNEDKVLLRQIRQLEGEAAEMRITIRWYDDLMKKTGTWTKDEWNRQLKMAKDQGIQEGMKIATDRLTHPNPQPGHIHTYPDPSSYSAGARQQMVDYENYMRRRG